MTPLRVDWRHPAAMAALFLVIGWWPFSLHPPNRVSWLSGRGGLAFVPSGIAYDDLPLGRSTTIARVQPGDGATFELVVEAAARPSSGVSEILTIDDGRTPPTLVLGQWRSELLVRRPAATGPRRVREVGARLLQPRVRRVVIVSGDASGTAFYADGRLVERMPDFPLGAEVLRGRLTVGDGATGRNSWTGRLSGIAIFARPVTLGEVVDHSAAWSNGDVSAMRRDPALLALYTFDERAGVEARDQSTYRHRLQIPERYVVLRKTVLEFPGIGFPIGLPMVGDIVVNLAGFVPFGFLAFLGARAALSRWPVRAAVAVLSGAALSLTIEIGQVWLPTRNSTAADLGLNVAGSIVGVVLAQVWEWEVRRRGDNRPTTPHP